MYEIDRKTERTSEMPELPESSPRRRGSPAKGMRMVAGLMADVTVSEKEFFIFRSYFGKGVTAKY